MARKLSWIIGVAVVVAGAGLWLAREGATPGNEPEKKPEVAAPTAAPAQAGPGKNAPAAAGNVVQGPARSPIPAADSPGQAIADRVSRARQRWEPIAQGVRALGEADQAGLDRLYAQASEAIRADEEAMVAMITQSMGALVGASFEESFFAVSAWVRSSSSPGKILDAIWSYDPPADPQGMDSHHDIMTQATRYERVQAYGVRELRQQVERGKIELPQAEARRLAAAIESRAAHEKSLNLSIEMFQMLQALKAEDEIRRALQGHSPRDQEMIRGVLQAQ